MISTCQRRIRFGDTPRHQSVEVELNVLRALLSVAGIEKRKSGLRRVGVAGRVGGDFELSSPAPRLARR